MNKKQKSGFTLAEVLITLAIIGVVAALTLPTMIANHQKKVYVVQLQKAISTLEQGFKMMMADDAVDKLEYTSLFQLCVADCVSLNYGSDDVTTKFFDAWKKYFNISEISPVSDEYEEKFLDGSGSDAVGEWGDTYLKFADGMMVMAYCFPETYSDQMGLLYVDVNGEKGPNTYGRDIFEFFIMTDGTLEGAGDGTKETCTCSNCTGEACTSYLMTNGWIMDY